MNTLRFIGLCLALMLPSIYSFASGDGKNKKAIAMISSKEDTLITGGTQFNIFILALDTAHIDSVKNVSADTFLNYSFSGFTQGQFLDTFGELNIQVSASYDSANLPYYPKTVDFIVYGHNRDTQPFEIKVSGVLYLSTKPLPLNKII